MQTNLEQRKRFYKLLNKLDLARLGGTIAELIAQDQYSTRFLLELLDLNGIEGTLEHSPHITYRDVLEREALSAHFEDVTICLN